MSVNEKIISALQPLGYPVIPDLYAGVDQIYLTFNYSTRGQLFADDQPGYDIYLVQVHLFAPHGWNSVELRRQVKQKLFSAGFTWPESVDAGSSSQESREMGQHIVFECEIEEGVAVSGQI